jgi:hypothetical protein
MGRILRMAILVAVCCVIGGPATAQNGGSLRDEIWRFDRVDSIGRYPVKVFGHPQVIETSFGKAVKFDGVGDALFVGDHPLAGAATWTWEVIFKPDEDGAPQQRFFHLSVLDAAGNDTNDRMLFEIRIMDGQWCLDSFATTGDHKQTLLNCQKRHPFGQWYRVSAVYDGKRLRNYVGDELQGQGDVELPPQGAGRASIGARINLKDFFKGSIYESRFTRRALGPKDFLRMPDSEKR